MRLGFAVKVLGAGGLPSHDTRRHASGPHLSVSLDRLEAILGYLEDNRIGFYRMATALAPYASHPDLPRFRDQPRECAGGLARVGARANAAGIRLSTHPGQYTVLNSKDERVAALAVEELEVQAEILDGMGLGPEAGGGPPPGSTRPPPGRTRGPRRWRWRSWRCRRRPSTAWGGAPRRWSPPPGAARPAGPTPPAPASPAASSGCRTRRATASSSRTT